MNKGLTEIARAFNRKYPQHPACDLLFPRSNSGRVKLGHGEVYHRSWEEKKKKKEKRSKDGQTAAGFSSLRYSRAKLSSPQKKVVQNFKYNQSLALGKVGPRINQVADVPSNPSCLFSCYFLAEGHIKRLYHWFLVAGCRLPWTGVISKSCWTIWRSRKYYHYIIVAEGRHYIRP
jgi:hypothetical protein